MKINKVEAILVFVTMIQMLFWLHFFEGFTYAHEPNDFLDVTSFIFLSIIGYVLTRIIFSDGSLRAKWIYGTFLFLVVLNIGFGFLNEYSNHRNVVGFLDLDTKNINITTTEVLKSTNDYIVYGRKRRNNNELTLFRNRIMGDAFQETELSYVRMVVPIDYAKYRRLLVFSEKDSINLMKEFLEYAYPGNIYYIFNKNNRCCNSILDDNIDCNLRFVESWRGRNIDPLFHELRTSKLKDRIGKYSKTLDELFSPIVVDTTYVNDSYFLIYKGEYKKAKEYLKDLPLERRSFCEEKLRALGELD